MKEKLIKLGKRLSIPSLILAVLISIFEEQLRELKIYYWSGYLLIILAFLIIVGLWFEHIKDKQ